MTIAGTKHVNFSDAAFRSPIRRIGIAGTTARRAHDIIAVYIRAFLAAHLENRPESMPAVGDNRYPEVRLQVRDRPRS